MCMKVKYKFIFLVQTFLIVKKIAHAPTKDLVKLWNV